MSHCADPYIEISLVSDDFVQVPVGLLISTQAGSLTLVVDVCRISAVQTTCMVRCDRATISTATSTTKCTATSLEVACIGGPLHWKAPT
jgi:hypothetical protein